MISNYCNTLENFIYWKSCLFLLLFLAAFLLCSNETLIVLSSWGLNYNFFSLEFLIKVSSILFLLIVFIISVAVFLWSAFYMKTSFNIAFFYIVLTSFILSMICLLMSSGITTLILGWEGLGLSSFILIIFYQNWSSMNSGILTLMTNRVGDVFLLLSFSLLLSGSFWSSFVIYFLFLTAITKSAQWPFLNWLPAAMAAPTPVSALVHSSTLVTAGVWLLYNYIKMVKILVLMLMWTSILTLLIASLAALKETDLKKVVALSTLSQLGFMVYSLSLGNFSTTLFHVFTHALAKANLFLVVGKVLIFSFSEQDSRNSTPSLQSPMIFIGGSISTLSLSGIIFTSGFFSKEQILLNNVFNNSAFYPILLCVILMMTLAYCVKITYLLSLFVRTKSLMMSNSLSAVAIFVLSFASIFWGNITNGLLLNFFYSKNLDVLLWTMVMMGWTSFLLGFYLFFFLNNPNLYFYLTKFWKIWLSAGNSSVELMSSTLLGSTMKLLKGSLISLSFSIFLLLLLIM